MHSKLQTKVKLHEFRVCDDHNLCLLCGEYDEDHDDLFFKCHFSKSCFEEIK